MINVSNITCKECVRSHHFKKIKVKQNVKVVYVSGIVIVLH